MFDSAQVVIGRGRQDTGALHRAIAVAQQLCAAGKWDGRGRLVVHHPYDLLRRIQLSPALHYDYQANCQLRQAAFDLTAPDDYEVWPLSREWCRLHYVPETQALAEAGG